jgi:hypothetical protein
MSIVVDNVLQIYSGTRAVLPRVTIRGSGNYASERQQVMALRSAEPSMNTSRLGEVPRLQAEQLGVEPVRLTQRIVSADLDDPAVVQYDDEISRLSGRETVGDQDGHASRQAAQTGVLLEQPLLGPRPGWR